MNNLTRYTLPATCAFWLLGQCLLADGVDSLQFYCNMGIQSDFAGFGISNPGPDGKLYLTGGGDIYGNLFTTIQAFDPSTKVWTTLPVALPYPYYNNERHGTAFASNGKMYLSPGNGAGGWGSHEAIIEVDPVSGVAQERASVTGGGNIWGAAIVQAPASRGGVYVVGGWNGGGVASVQHYNPDSNTFRSIGQLSVGRVVGAKVVHPNGKVYLFGGNWGWNTTYMDVLDTQTEMVSPLSNPQQLAFDHTTLAWVGHDSKIYLWNSAYAYFGLDSGELIQFDPDKRTFQDLGRATRMGEFFLGAQSDAKGNVYFFSLVEPGYDSGAPPSYKSQVWTFDATPAAISAVTADPYTIWPPNHKMVSVTLNYTVTDVVDSNPAVSIKIKCNESAGDDWRVIDAHHVQLRADRLGSDNGRIYTITVVATDYTGNSSSREVQVTVPHDQGK